MNLIYTKTTGKIQQLSTDNQDINLLLENYEDADYIDIESLPCSWQEINSLYHIINGQLLPK